METLIQDLRYGLRMLRRSPGFTVVALVTLALGIGANTAIFSLIDAILMRMLPVQHPEELVEIGRITQYGSGGGFSYPIFEQFRDYSQVFSGVLTVSKTPLQATGGNETEPAKG